MSEAVIIGQIVHKLGSYTGLARLDVHFTKEEFCNPPEKNKALAERLGEIENHLNNISGFLKTLSQIYIQGEAKPTYTWDIFDAALRQVKVPQNVILVEEREESLPSFQATTTFIEVVRNLLLNAIEAMPDGGKLVLNAYVSPDDKFIVLSVKDTGSGIEPKIMNELFKQFVSTKENGQGLGLYWSRLYLEQLSAKIEVKSKVGEGTLVEVFLPLST